MIRLLARLVVCRRRGHLPGWIEVDRDFPHVWGCQRRDFPHVWGCQRCHQRLEP